MTGPAPRLTYHNSTHWHTRLTPLPAPRPWRRWAKQAVGAVALVCVFWLILLGCWEFRE